MELPTVKIGLVDIDIPILGLGAEVVFSNASEERSRKVFMTAIESGIRYIDTAHDYKHSEERLGKFIRETGDLGFIVATKSMKRNGDEFMQDLEESISRLQRTPDILHVHNIDAGEEDVILHRNGPLAAALKAKSEGTSEYAEEVRFYTKEDADWDSVKIRKSLKDFKK